MSLDCSVDDEVFFGEVSERERIKMAKLKSRKTEVYHGHIESFPDFSTERYDFSSKDRTPDHSLNKIGTDANVCTETFCCNLSEDISFQSNSNEQDTNSAFQTAVSQAFDFTIDGLNEIDENVGDSTMNEFNLSDCSMSSESVGNDTLPVSVTSEQGDESMSERKFNDTVEEIEMMMKYGMAYFERMKSASEKSFNMSHESYAESQSSNAEDRETNLDSIHSSSTVGEHEKAFVRSNYHGQNVDKLDSSAETNRVLNSLSSNFDSIHSSSTVMEHEKAFIRSRCYGENIDRTGSSAETSTISISSNNEKNIPILCEKHGSNSAKTIKKQNTSFDKNLVSPLNKLDMKKNMTKEVESSSNPILESNVKEAAVSCVNINNSTTAKCQTVAPKKGIDTQTTNLNTQDDVIKVTTKLSANNKGDVTHEGNLSPKSAPCHNVDKILKQNKISKKVTENQKVTVEVRVDTPKPKYNYKRVFPTPTHANQSKALTPIASSIFSNKNATAKATRSVPGGHSQIKKLVKTPTVKTPISRTKTVKTNSAKGSSRIPSIIPPSRFLTPQHRNLASGLLDNRKLTPLRTPFAKSLNPRREIVSPVARYLQNNPPPPLIATVKPKSRISPYKFLQSEESPSKVIYKVSHDNLGNESILRREEHLKQIDNDMEQLSLKVNALLCPKPSDAEKLKPVLPSLSYTKVDTAYHLDNKENVSTRRMIPDDSPASILKHKGRFKLPKNALQSCENVVISPEKVGKGNYYNNPIIHSKTQSNCSKNRNIYPDNEEHCLENQGNCAGNGESYSKNNDVSLMEVSVYEPHTAARTHTLH